MPSSSTSLAAERKSSPSEPLKFSVDGSTSRDYHLETEHGDEDGDLDEDLPDGDIEDPTSSSTPTEFVSGVSTPAARRVDASRTQASVTPLKGQTGDEDELEKFREEWRREVERQKKEGKKKVTSIGDSIAKEDIKAKTVRLNSQESTSKGSGSGSGPSSGPELTSSSLGLGDLNDDGVAAGNERAPSSSTAPVSSGHDDALALEQQLASQLNTDDPRKSVASSSRKDIPLSPKRAAELRKSPVASSSKLPSTKCPPQPSFSQSGVLEHPGPSSSASSSQPQASSRTGQHATHPHPHPHAKHLQDLDKAVDMYGQAVEYEKGGRLNDALRLYRKAYKIDAAVQRTYNRNLAQQEKEQEEAALETLEVVDPSIPIAIQPEQPREDYTFHAFSQFHPDYVSSNTSRPKRDSSAQWDDPLSRLIRKLKPPGYDPTDLSKTAALEARGGPYFYDFEAEEEKYPLLIRNLPDEVLDHVVDYLDVRSLERLALVNKKLRVLTARAKKWRTLCETLYVSPVVPAKWSLQATAARHAFDWRSTFLEESRIRFDGVYISVCHYVRPGQSDMAWVEVTHLITYHRFLRFYPDGMVISFLTTDHPVDVVHNIHPNLRQKGLLFGRWRLTTPEIDPVDAPSSTSASDPTAPTVSTVSRESQKARSQAQSQAQGTLSRPGSGTKHSKASPPVMERRRVEIREMLEPGIVPKYEFEMDLELKTTTRGRWNKLDMLTYQSINLASGEALGLSLKHQKPFYFSKVRSYEPTL